MKRFLVLFLIAFTVEANENKTISFDPPTERENGVALSDEEISHYNLYCNDSLFETIINENEISEVELFFPRGEYSCYMTAVDTDELESGPSNIAEFNSEGVARPISIRIS